MKNEKGMTMIEIVVVCMVVGLLTAIAVSGMRHLVQKRKNATVASQLRLAAQAFELCKLTTGSYPPDTTPRVVPDGMQVFFDELKFDKAELDWTTTKNIMGGLWDWDLGQFGCRAGISVYQPSVSDEQMADVDRMIDDGDLNTGHFRKRSQGYIFIMEK